MYIHERILDSSPLGGGQASNAIAWIVRFCKCPLATCGGPAKLVMHLCLGGKGRSSNVLPVRCRTLKQNKFLSEVLNGDVCVSQLS